MITHTALRMRYFAFIFTLCFSMTLYTQRINEDEFEIRHFTVEDGLPSNTVYNMAMDTKGFIWLVTDNGLSRFDGISFNNYFVKDGLKDNLVLAIQDFDSFFILSSFKGLNILYKDKIIQNFDIHGVKTNTGWHAHVENQKLYISNLDSFYIYDISNFSNMKQIESHKKLGNPNPKTLLEIVTSNGHPFQKFHRMKDGLALIDEKNNQIVAYSFFDSLRISIYVAKLDYLNQNFSEGKNQFLFNDRNQMKGYHFDRNKLVKTKYKAPLGQKKAFLPLDSINFIFSTVNAGIYHIKKRRNTHLVSGQILLDRYKIRNIEEDKLRSKNCLKCFTSYGEDSFLIGTCQGLYHIQKSKLYSKISQIKNHAFLNKVYSKRTYSIYIDQNRDIYIGSFYGLYKYRNSDHKLVKIIFSKKSEIKVNSITGEAKNIWISTAGDGIYILEKSTMGVKRMSKETELMSDENTKIILDWKKRLWISSSYGVMIVDGNRRFNIDRKEGLTSNEVEDFYVIADTAYIYTNSGVQRYEYSSLSKSVRFPLYLNASIVNNVLVSESLDDFPPTTYKLEFQFSSIYWDQPNQIQYHHRVTKDGNVQPWAISKSKNLVYENMSSGDYLMEVYASHTNNVNIRSNLLVKKFQIKPYYYQSNWFYTLIVLSLTGLISLYFFRNYKRKMKALEYQKEFAKLKLEALKAEMNPHFIFNVLNTIKEAMMDGDFATSQNQLSKLAKLIRQSLYNTKRDFLSLDDEIQFIDLYVDLERERFNRKFDYIKNIDDRIFHYEIPTMLLQPFFENAIRHGKIGQLACQGKLYFEVSESDKDLVLIIRDNGVGLEKAKKNKEANMKEHKSMALEIIQERIQLFQKTHGLRIDLRINSIDVEGYRTEVRLTIEKDKE